MSTDPWLLPAFFLIALFYSAAGFGGGSSYLAVLSLTGLPVSAMRPVALICNLIVTGSSSVRYALAGVIPWQRALPLVLGSIPAAYLGGRIELPREDYLLLLGFLLLLAGILMLVQTPVGRPPPSGRPTWSSGPSFFIHCTIGIGIGFLAGLVGIGGGIFLSPLLFLTNWASARRIAATTSLFIALNSLAGLAGQLSTDLTVPPAQWLPLAGAVMAGGWLGTRLTLSWLEPATIRKVAAALILLVGGRLVWVYL